MQYLIDQHLQTAILLANSGYGGGRGRGCGGNRGGGRIGGRDGDKLYCTHGGRYRHTRETCWDLNHKPQNVTATPAEVEHPGGTTEQETRSQHWKDELSILRQTLAALEGVTQDSSAGMTSSHNPTTFASSASSSTWVIDSGGTDHVTRIRSAFCLMLLPPKEG